MERLPRWAWLAFGYVAGLISAPILFLLVGAAWLFLGWENGHPPYP